MRLLSIDFESKKLSVFEDKKLLAAYTFNGNIDNETLDELLQMEFKEENNDPFDWVI